MTSRYQSKTITLQKKVSRERGFNWGVRGNGQVGFEEKDNGLEILLILLNLTHELDQT